MRKSYLSVYSRLQNIVPEETKTPTKSWNTENKSKLVQRMKALSTPKKIIEVEEDRSRNRLRSEGPKMRRIRKLSKPRIRKEIIPNEWMFTKGLKNFKPTERLLKISQPKKYDELTAREDPHRIPQNALNYKASRRIKALAEPAKTRVKIEVHPENPFKTNLKALKAVASKRVQELANPKDYIDENNRSDAYRVSRKALQAKATPRLKELAEPRKRT
ncbi:testicular haploid expressed gene protein-like isoform X3 [Musca domestica]|nr:testicular haploid expressed gene protein-like isoform X3 [Musca domestica]